MTSLEGTHEGGTYLNTGNGYNSINVATEHPVLIDFIYAFCLIGALWVLGKYYGPFQRWGRRKKAAKTVETLPRVDGPNCDDTTDIGYTFRCSDPEVERARVMYIRGLGSKILRRMDAGPEILDSLSEDPYKRLEDIEKVRQKLAKAWKEPKWLTGFRSVFSSRSSEEIYGLVTDVGFFNAINGDRYINPWYRYRCDDLNDERARVQHLRMLNDRIWFTMPPVDWSNEPYSYDRNWCEDPLEECERIERVRQKVQLDLRKERTWSARLPKLLYFLLVTINPMYPWFWRRPSCEHPSNNDHELSQCHVHKMHLYRETIAPPATPRSNPEAPRAFPATPPVTPTRNTASSRTQAPNGPAARPKALPKRGPSMNTAKIHSLDTRYRYFVSTGPHPGPLPTPCDIEPFEKGDLYVHRYTEDNVQVWLMEDNGAWRSISSGHRHPTLPRYRLNVLPATGKPNWVLRETWMGVARRNMVTATT